MTEPMNTQAKKAGEVILICGPVCSGKTTLAERHCRETGAVNLSADELTLTLFGPDAGEDHDRLAARARAYLLALAVRLSRAGVGVTLDWGFWTPALREEALSALRAADVPVRLWRVDVSPETRRRLIGIRNAAVGEGRAAAYTVDEGLARKCMELYDPPRDDECDRVIRQDGR